MKTLPLTETIRNKKVWNVLNTKVYPLAVKIKEEKFFLNRDKSFNERKNVIELLFLFVEYHNLLHWCIRNDYATTLFWFGVKIWSKDEAEILAEITLWIRKTKCISEPTRIKLENGRPLEDEEIDSLIWNLPWLYEEEPNREKFPWLFDKDPDPTPIALPNLFFGARYYWSIIKEMYIIEHTDDALADYVHKFYRWYLQDQITSLETEDMEIIMEGSNFDELRELFIKNLELHPLYYLRRRIDFLDIKFMRKFYEFILYNHNKLGKFHKALSSFAPISFARYNL